MARKVEPVRRFHDEVLADFQAPSTLCVAGADLLLEELEEQDPDPAERCGLLADRYEVYALKVPRCASLVLLVSLDLKADRCVVHGLKPGRARPCQTARRLAVKHFDLIDPSWEPANG